MSVSIDEKVVEMRFNNRQFEKGIQTSINSINNLNKAADFTASQKGVKDLQSSFSKFNLGTAVRGVESFSLKVSALGVAGAEVVRRITNSAIDLGKRITGVISKPIEMAKSGGIARALNIEQAKFQLEGLKVKWDDIKDDIDYGVRDTAYGLDAAAKAASQLVASNVKLGDEMKGALRGISGVAAMTNSSYEDISDIFTTVAGNGKLMTMQLRQLSSRGLNIAAELGKQLGKSEAEIREMVTHGEIDFNTFATAMDSAFGQHAKDANKTFEGSMSNVKASLSRIGATFAGPIYTNIISPLNALKGLTKTIEETIAKPAEKFGKLTKNLADLGTAFMTNENIIKAVGNTTKGIINIFKFGMKIFKQVAQAFVEVFPPKTVKQIREASENFKDFTKSLSLSERQIEIIKAAAKGVFATFKIFSSLIKGTRVAIMELIKSPVGEFLGDLIIKISNALVNISNIVQDIVNADDSLINGFKRAIDAVRPFSGTLSAIGDTLSEVFSKIREEADKLFGNLPEGLKNILNSFNDTADGVDKRLSDSLAYKFIHGLGVAFRVAATLIVNAAHGIFNALSNLMEIIGREGGFGELIKDLFAAGIYKQIQKLTKTIRGSLNIMQSFSGVLNATRGALLKYQKMLSARMILSIAIAIGVLAASLLLLSKIPGKHIVSALAGVAGAAMILAGSFIVLKKSLGEGSLLGSITLGPQIIAMSTAILIMSAALKNLAKLDISKIGSSLVGLAGIATIMVTTVKILSSGSRKAIKGSVQMLIMAQSIKSLAGTLKELADLDIKRIGTGLAGIGGILLSLAGFSKLMNKVKINLRTALSLMIVITALKQMGDLVATVGVLDYATIGKGIGAIGIILTEIASTAFILSKVKTSGLMDMIFAMGSISNGLVVMTDVVKTLGSMDIKSLGAGVGAVGVLVAEISALAAVLNHNKGILKSTVGIYIVGQALTVITEAVKQLGGMNQENLIRGLLGVTAVIFDLSAALAVMSHQKHTFAASVAIFNLSLALKVLSGTVQTFGNMKWKELEKGLVGLAGAMGTLVTSALLLRKGLPGASAMVIMSAALLTMVPSLLTIGSMPIDDIRNVFLAISGVFAILITSAAVAKPIATGFAIITKALLSFAASMIGIGAGMFMFAASMDMLLSAKARIMSAKNDFMKIAVSAGKALVKFITEVIKGLSGAADKIANAITKIVVAIVKNIREAIPELVNQAYKMMLEFIDSLAEGAEKYIPKLIKGIGKLVKKIIKAIGGYFKEFDGLGEAAVAKIAAVGVAITLIFRSIAKSISGISSAKGIGAALVVIAGIISIAASLFLLAQQPWDGLIVAAGSLSLVLIAMGKAMQIISNTNISLGTIGAFAAASLSVLAIGTSLSLIANMPWSSLLAGAAALSSVLYSYTAVFELLSKMKVSAKTLLNIGIFTAGTLALAPLVVGLKILASEDYKSLLSATLALSTTLLAVGALFGIMSVIPTGAVIGAVANLAVAIGGLGLILTAFGAIKQIPGVDWLINEGSEFANLIGEAIGGFVGSIVSGFGKALSSLLPQIGLDLTAFWVNATPFFDGISMVGNDTMQAVQSLATALITLTAAELIQGIANFFGADVNFKDFGQQLADFADGMVVFAEKTAGLDAENVEKAANAAAMLGEFASSVPLTGGLLGDLMGNRDLKGFSEALPLLGEGLAKFGNKTKKLDNEAIEAATNSAKMLAELNQNIPLTGGLLGDLMGNKDLAQFGEQLPKLGEGLAKFGNKTKKLNSESIDAAANSAKMLAELNQNIPLTGGLLGDLMGDKDLGKFGDQLPKLGKGLKKFAEKTKGMDVDAATNATTVAQMLGALAADIPNEGGIISWFEGDSSLESFGEQLPGFGKNVKKFADKIKGLDVRVTGSVSGLLNTVVNILKFANNEGISASYVSEFSSALISFGSGYKQFILDAGGNNTYSLSLFTRGIDSIIKTIKKISKVDTSKIKSFTDDLRGLTEAGLNDVKTASTATVDSAIDALKHKKAEFRTVGDSFVDQTRIGIAVNGYKIKETLVKACDNAATIAGNDTQKAKYALSGKYLIDGFVEGMSDDERIQKVVAAAKKVADAAKNSINDTLRVESPSKEMIETGKFTSEGLAIGIENNAGVVENAGYKIGNRVGEGIVASKREARKGAKDVVNTVKSTIDDGFSIDKAYDVLGLEKQKDVPKTDKSKAKKDGEDTGKAIAEGIGSQSNTDIAEKSGKSISSSAAKGVKFGKKDLEKALKSYRYIMGTYVKSYKKFSDEYLSVIMSKKGLGRLKITPEYLMSGIKDKYLRTAASKLGKDFIKSMNSGIRKELKRNNATSDILKDLDEVGKKLVKARKKQREANSIINNKKSTEKDISGARKALEAANKDIDKYQKKIEQLQKKLKKAGSSVAKTLTKQSINELSNSMKEFKKVFNKMGDKEGTYLSKIPSVLSAYLNNTKSAASYGKSVISSVKKIFGSSIKSVDKSTKKQINELDKKIKIAEKKRKEALKVLDDKKSSKQNKKKAKKDIIAAEKTIKNVNNKINKLKATSVVDKFAERLYYNSESYADEVKQIKASTKKIKKIREAAAKAKANLGKATSNKDKKKYADELKELQKQYKEEEKILAKSASNIAKGPAKALKAFKLSLKETLKDMLSIASLDFTPKIKLEGFDKFEKTTNLIEQSADNTDIFSKAVAKAGSNFSIFGDISEKTGKSFSFFNNAVSTGINLLERFTKVGSVEKQALFENADSQLDAYEEFYKGIEELRSRGLGDAIVDDLKSQGPSALNYIRGFLSMTQDEINSYNNRISKMSEYGAANYISELKSSMMKEQKFAAGLEELATLGLKSDVIEEFKSMGAESAQGYVDSLLVAGKDSITELNDLYAEYTSTSSASLLAAAQEQYEASMKYDEIINQLKNTVLDPGIIKEVEAMGAEEAISYGKSILAHVDEIPSLNELYWKSQTGGKTMVQQMQDANAEMNQFNDDLKTLEGYGLNGAFIKYVKDLGIEEGTEVIQRAIREFGSLSSELRAQQVELFNAEYAKSKSEGKTPAEVLIDNLTSQVKGYDEYNANLEKVLTNLGGDEKTIYFKYLKEMGMDGAEYVEALANATTDQIQAYRKLIDDREARNRQEQTKAILDSWQSEIDTVKNFSVNMAALIKRGASQTLVDDLASMDIKEAATKVEALLGMDVNSWNDFNKSYKETMEKNVGDIVNSLTGVFATGGEFYKSNGAKMAQKQTDGYNEGINGSTESMAAAENSAYNATALAVYPTIEKNSSEAGSKSAKSFAGGIVLGTIANTAVFQNAGVYAGNEMSKSLASKVAAAIGNAPAKAIVKAFKKGLTSDSMIAKIQSSGEAICDGVNAGIALKSNTVKEKATTLSWAIYDQFSNNLNIVKGQSITSSFCNGIYIILVTKKPVMETAATNCGSSIVKAIGRYVSYSNGYYLGSQMLEGLIIGMEEQADRAEAAAERLAESVNNKFKKLEEIDSPSKVWRSFGAYMGAGLALGLSGSANQVSDAAENLAISSNSELQRTISRIRSGINSELDFNPVITPTLDLSKVSAKAQAINAMMENTTVGATVTTRSSAEDETNQNRAVTYNFEQNNYSPKALSRLEIYRQTRNQFAMAKEALH